MKFTHLLGITAVTAVAAVAVVGVAQASPVTTVTPSHQHDWFFDTPSPKITYSDNGLTFDPISTVPAEKLYMAHDQMSEVSSFGDTSVTFEIPSSVVNKAANEFYVNVYVDTNVQGPSFYDCRYDFVLAAPVVGANTLSFTRDKAPTAVVSKNDATCGTTIASAPEGSSAFRVAINAGDTSANDAGLTGTIQSAVISGVQYEFRADPVVPVVPTSAPATSSLPTSAPTVDPTSTVTPTSALVGVPTTQPSVATTLIPAPASTGTFSQIGTAPVGGVETGGL